MRLFKTFKGVTVCALIISVVAAIAGMLISLILATATGPTVVAVDLIIFIVSFIIGSIKNKRN
jgi:zinc transport system permease protein